MVAAGALPVILNLLLALVTLKPAVAWLLVQAWEALTMRVSPPLRSLKVTGPLAVAARVMPPAPMVRVGAVVEGRKVMVPLAMVMELATLLPAVETLKAEVTLVPAEKTASEPSTQMPVAEAPVGSVVQSVAVEFQVCWVVELVEPAVAPLVSKYMMAAWAEGVKRAGRARAMAAARAVVLNMVGFLRVR